MALSTGKPAIFHSDQGSQYSAWLHTELLLQARVKISMSDRGKPMQNGIAERFMRTLKAEHVAYADYADFDDALRQIAYWLTVVYNTRRIHSALRYATPAEAEAARLCRQPLSVYSVSCPMISPHHTQGKHLPPSRGRSPRCPSGFGRRQPLSAQSAF